MKLIMRNLKTITLSLCIGVLFAGGAVFAVWDKNTWHGTDWVADGARVGAMEFAENFEYLLGLQGGNCTEYSKTSVRYHDGTLEYCDGITWINTEVSENITSTAVSATWYGTSWIESSSALITAQKIAGDFQYILGIRGGNCTVHNEGRIRYSSYILEYCNSGTWTPTDVYVWDVGAWSVCTGTQIRTVECIDEDAQTVIDGKCHVTKPITSQSCIQPVISEYDWTGHTRRCRLDINNPSNFKLVQLQACGPGGGTKYFFYDPVPRGSVTIEATYDSGVRTATFQYDGTTITSNNTPAVTAFQGLGGMARAFIMNDQYILMPTYDGSPNLTRMKVRFTD